MTTGPNKEKLILGALICTAGYFFIAVMGAFSKLVSLNVSALMILFFQNLVCLLLTLPHVIKQGWPLLKTTRKGLHLTRDFCGVMSFFCLFLSLKSISLVDGVLLQNTAPLWIPLVAFVWLKIKVRGHIWWGMLLGFLGIILILKPGFGVLNIASLLGVASGIFLAVALISIRRLASTEPTTRILFYYFLFGTIVTLPFLFIHFVTPSLKDFLYMLGVGISMYIAQMLITYSFKHGKASTYAPIAYSAVVYSGILGWLIWNTIPDFLSLIGLLLVIIGGLISLYYERKLAKTH